MVDRESLVHVEGETLRKKVKATVAGLCPCRKLGIPIVDVIQELLLMLAFEGQLLEKGIEKSHTQRPNIGLFTVEFFI